MCHLHSPKGLLGTPLIPCLTPFRLENCLNSMWHWFNKVLKLMEICGMHIQGTKLPFHHIPKMLYWV